MRENKRKTRFIKGSFQKQLLIFIVLAAVIPALVVGACLYFIIFNLLAYQIGIPETIAYNLLPVLRQVNLIILVVFPVLLAIIWFVALVLSHRIAGPLYRIEKELDARISGRKQGPIVLRKKDELKSLVEKINRLLGERNNSAPK